MHIQTYRHAYTDGHTHVQEIRKQESRRFGLPINVAQRIKAIVMKTNGCNKTDTNRDEHKSRYTETKHL